MTLQSTATAATATALGFGSFAELQGEWQAEWVTVPSGAQVLLVAEPTWGAGVGTHWEWDVAATIYNGVLDLASWVKPNLGVA